MRREDSAPPRLEPRLEVCLLELGGRNVSLAHANGAKLISSVLLEKILGLRAPGSDVGIEESANATAAPSKIFIVIFSWRILIAAAGEICPNLLASSLLKVGVSGAGTPWLSPG